MSTTEPRIELTDSQLAVELLKKKLVTEVQLKAAIDFQESVGGGLLDVLMKLGLVPAQALDDFLKRLQSGDEETTRAVKATVTPPDVSKLKVHRKLLEKVPDGLAQRYGVLVFFPPLGTRAILLSTDPPAPDSVVRKLQSRLGIELQPIDLSPKDRRPFLSPRRPEPPPAPQGADVGSAAKTGTGEEPQLLTALINLLIHKNILSGDELKVELELLKRRKG